MSADPWDEAVAKARKAIYDDGRGMIGRNRNYLQDRVARAILAERKEAADANAKLLNIARLARDVSLAATQDDAGRWIITGDAETMLGDLYTAVEDPEIRSALQGDADVSRGGGE